MITLKLSNKMLFEQSVEGYIIFMEQDVDIAAVLKKEYNSHYRPLHALLHAQKFSGKPSQVALLPLYEDNRLFYIIVIGIGKLTAREPQQTELYRRALGRAIRIAEEKQLDSLAIALPNPALFDADEEYLSQQTAITIQMAAYKCTEFFSNQEKHHTVTEVTLVYDDKLDKKQIHEGIKTGNIIAESVNRARYWVDLPPSRLTPPDLMASAKAIAQEHGLTFTVFDENEVNQMGMGGLAAVSRGSDRDCQFVVMEYKVKKENAPTLVFVGKGITFDSGGLSLKPAAYMETMKEDMSGAAAVIASMRAIALLKPEVNIVGITPLSENLPSGKATKPGDVVRFYNGKTAEIKNTDAEGRLILADALSYAVKHYNADAIIDLATLTGACAHALGPFFSGLMGKDHTLLDKIEEAAVFSGDRVWQLPLDDDYDPAIQSTIADICNIGSKQYLAGAITAACFLKNFVGEVPWAHLDIAGTAYNVPDISYYRPEGATGVGVRLLVDIALNWNNPHLP